MQRQHTYRPVIISAALFLLLGMVLFLYHTWDAKHIRQWKVTIRSADSAAPGMLAGVTYKGFMAGMQERYYFRDLVYIGDTARLENIFLTGNGERILIDHHQLDSFDATGIYIPPGMIPAGYSKQMYVVHKDRLQWPSLLPVFKKFINWGGDEALTWKIIFHPLMLFYLFCLIIFYAARRSKAFNHEPLTSNHQSLTGNRQPVTYIHHLLAGILFIALVFIVFSGDKYYFLQDDNYTQFTPVIVNGMDGWYNNGTFPTYNALQLAGSPTFSYSTYAFLYPGAHISYIISRFILNDAYQFNNVFALLHFAIGFFFSYRLLLRLKLHPALAIVAALSFIFCGFNLVAVRSWYYVAPTICFLPALFYLLVKKPVNVPVKKNWLWPTILFVLYAFSGNFQYWVYTFGFFALFELARQNKHGSIKNGLLYLGLIFIISLAFFSPQLIATFNETKDLPRSGGEGQGILAGFGAMILPVTGVGALPNGWGRSDLHRYDAVFYQGGFIFLLIALAALLFWLLRGKNRLLQGNQYAVARIFLLLLALAFIFSLGRSGLLWWLMAKLPLLDKFNHPFKFLLYVQFFGIVAGAVLFQQILEQGKNFKTYLYISAAVTLCLLCIMITQSKQAFYKYEYQRPYPAIAWLNRLDAKKDYRIMPIGPLRSPDTGYESSLQMNFPMVYGIPSLDGYEPLNHYGADVYRYHREYGVRYFIESKHKPEPNGFAPRNNELSLFKEHQSFREIYTDAQVNVYEDTLYNPVVQLYDQNGNGITAINIQYRNNGVDVQLPQKTTIGRMRLAFITRKGLKIYYDDRPCRKFLQDAAGRIYCTEVLPASVIRIRYDPF